MCRFLTIFFFCRNPSNTDLTRRYSITFDMYKSATQTLVEDLNTDLNTAELSKSEELNRVGIEGVTLGDAVYLEGCIEIADTRKYFSMSFTFHLFTTVYERRIVARDRLVYFSSFYYCLRTPDSSTR